LKKPKIYRGRIIYERIRTVGGNKALQRTDQWMLLQALWPKRMNREDKATHMSANDNDPYIAGARIVRIVIIALFIVLVGDRFGGAISLLNFMYAMALALILDFLCRAAWRDFLARRK
jgi:hypothetical protein